MAYASFAPVPLAAAAPSPDRRAPQEAKIASDVSVRDGVFTENQAARGRQTFETTCRSCHTLAEHTGNRFAAKWEGASVVDIFDVISNTMPEGNPGSLTAEEYVSVIAYFLMETGYRGGKQDLPADRAALAKIRIEAPDRTCIALPDSCISYGSASATKAPGCSRRALPACTMMYCFPSCMKVIIP
jgi:cytochrome c5